ncbi:MAG: TetR/AcrR family transcriptional regulator [Alphaproteobacteria bacterium]|nr:TetR/AcrR family transcriptional regulator [Alphaproteobacteria bacterium]
MSAAPPHDPTLPAERSDGDASAAADPLRRRVLDASLVVVERDGVAGLSIRAVARAAGVSHQAPYKHFENREEILATLVAEGFDGLADALEGAATAGDGVARLGAAGRAYVQWAVAHPGSYRLLFRPDLVSATHPEVQRAGGRALDVLRTVVAAMVDDGVLYGDYAEPVLVLAWSTVHGLASLLIDGPLPLRGGALDADALIADVPARLAAGIAARGWTTG